MATKAELARSESEREQSKKRRAQAPKARPNKNAMQHEFTAASEKGRARHASTKLRADAKALKPYEGPVESFWKTGNNGGEEQTRNGVASGRGADGRADVHKASRKSTRGSWPAGEKRSAQLTTRTQNAVSSPQARARRGK